jgi:hypothetical protein
VVTDIDGDRDLDVLVLGERQRPVVAANDRLLRFRRVAGPDAGAQPWTGGLVLDLDHDGRSEVLLLAAGQAPALWKAKSRTGLLRIEDTHFDRVAVPGPPLRQAVAIDLDRDGWTDVVGLSDVGVPVWLRNEGGQLTWRPGSLGPAPLWPKDLVALTVLPDPNRPVLVAWSESAGLHLVSPRDNGNCGLLVRLVGQGRGIGHRRTRCNVDGVGA